MRIKKPDQGSDQVSDSSSGASRQKEYQHVSILRTNKIEDNTSPDPWDIDPEKIPAELRSLPHWVCWRFEERKGKQTKVPISPATGAEADVKNKTLWVPFDQAIAYQRRQNNINGIGWVFSDDDPFTGIDVDKCISNGQYSELARSVLNRFPGSYAEVSPSGTGLKLWLRGKLPVPPEKSGRKIPKLGIETYCRKRYFTVTSQVIMDVDSGRLPDHPPVIADHDEELQRWFAELFPSVKPADKTDKTPVVTVSASIAEIIAKASGARNGEKFKALWAGDCSRYGDDESGGDLALLSMLAFWCGNDAGLIDEVFRQSGMYREKWERRDYRDRTIATAIESCPEPYDWARSANTQSQGLQKRERQHQGTVAPPPWPELVALSGPEPESVDVEDLPRSVGEIIKSVTEYAEVPPELPLLMTLGALATACQKKWDIQSDGSHKEPLSLFVCPALDPGNRKSSVVGALTAPLWSWEIEERIKLEPEIRRAQSEKRTAEARISTLRAKAAKIDDRHEREKLQNEISELEENQSRVPALPVILTSDVTPEKLASLMAEQHEKMAVISDEAGIFEIAGGRYSNGKANLDVFLQGHAGSAVRVHRGSREPVDLRNPALTVAVTVQPSVLFDIGQNQAFKGRGLLARFLFAVPKSTLGFRKLEPRPIAEAVKDRWHRIVHYLLNSEQSEDETGVPISRTIVMTEHAARLWKSEQRHNEGEMRPGEVWGSQTDWASKYPGAVARIAGVLHCADCADRQRDPAAEPLPETTMLHAVRLGRKIKAHTLKAFGAMALNDDQKLALKIADWIRREGRSQFTGRECCRTANSHGKKSSEMKGALEILSDCGWIRQHRSQPEGAGRPSEIFSVNPAVHKCADNADKIPDDQSGGRILSAVSAVSEMTEEPTAGADGILSAVSAVSANIFQVEDEDPEYSFPSDRS